MIWIVALLLVFLLAFGAAVAAHLLFWSRNEVPFVRTPKKALEQIIYALSLSDSGTIYELGCGYGIVLEAILRHTKAIVIGVDNNPMVLAVAWFRVGKRARLVRGDILKTDLSEASRVFCYLSDRQMANLELTLKRQLKSGAKLVSLQFRLPNTKPNQVLRIKNGSAWAANIYIYDF